MACLTTALLSDDVEKACCERNDAPRLWSDYLEGCAPILSQLATDAQKLSLRHQWAEIDVVRGTIASSSTAIGLAAIAGQFEASVVAGVATLLGRYARVDEIAIGIWRPDSEAWLPLRVSLLKPERERGCVDDSSVTPSSAFATIRFVVDQVSQTILRGSGQPLLDAAGLRALDEIIACGANEVEKEYSHALEVGVAFGGSPSLSTRPTPPLMMIFSDSRATRASINCELRFLRRFFGKSTAVRMQNHLAAVLESMVANADALVCDVTLTSERRGVSESEEIQKWSDAYTTSCYCAKSGANFRSAERSITALIDDVTINFPDAVALVDDGQDAASFTYSDLAAASGKIARILRQAGVGRDILVPLMAPRSADMIFALFGILYAGGAYVPLDLQWPDDRIQDVLEQCCSPVVLGDGSFCDRLKKISFPARVVCIQDALNERSASSDDLGNKSAEIDARDLVYVFFTSGTTGKPKGVMVEHAGLTHRIDWFMHRFPLRHGDGIMLKHAYTFGLSEWEIFWPLCSGATLLLAPPGGEKDVDYILRRTCDVYTPAGPQKDSVLRDPMKLSSSVTPIALVAHVFVPSMLQMVLERLEELENEEQSRMGDERNIDVTAWWRRAPLRQIITCGEALTETVAQRALARISQCAIANLYGPTEGEMTVWDFPREGDSLMNKVPAGAPMQGSKLILADLREEKNAASLEPAEISFGGPFIARGYLGRPDLTSKAFVPDFTEDSSSDSRLYMTGDLGRWREGGCLELLGRRDFQVKLRGFRIELGEIEAALRAVGCRAAVCVVRPGVGGAAALVAYYEHGADGPVSEAAVRSSCKQRLPPYMQPQIIMALDKLPRNAGGKVDRPKLPQPIMKSAESGTHGPSEDVADTLTERAVAAAWADVLGLSADRVPVCSDFQDLGGTSLLAGRVTAAIRKSLQLSNLPGTVLYQNPTVRRLAAKIDCLLAEQIANKTQKNTDSGWLVPACQQRICPPSYARPAAMLIQIFGVVGLNFFFESMAWSPFWWSAWFIYANHGRTALLFALPFVILLHDLFDLGLTLILKWLIVGRQKPGSFPLWTVAYFRWWFVDHLVRHQNEKALPLLADTPLISAWLRLLGASVGSGASISVVRCSAPDLLIIGDGVTLGSEVVLNCSVVLRGAVHLGEIKFGDHSAAGPGAALPLGANIPALRAVLPLSTAAGCNGANGSVAHVDAIPRWSDAESRRFWRRQNMIRTLVGVPWLVFMQAFPWMCTVFVLEWVWSGLYSHLQSGTFVCFMFLLPWISVHPTWICSVLAVILQKWLVIGRFRPGKTELTQWSEFRHWLHARSVQSNDFTQAAEMWINTELLSCIYRCLGMRIGRRVQIDAIKMVEHDCIEVCDYITFGSKVVMSCDARAPWISGSDDPCDRGFETIRLCRGSNVLDHSVLGPGTTVGERAVLGTSTLALRGEYFQPMAVHSGNARGRSLHLRSHNPSGALREMEEIAMRRVDCSRIWWTFNACLAFMTVLVKPLPEAGWVLVFWGVCGTWDPESNIVSLFLIVPWLFFAVSVTEILAVVLSKWIIVGRFKEMDILFFSPYHLKWMLMTFLKGATSDLSEAFAGTIFEAWFLRSMGARIGKNCYLAGLEVEYDLCDIGDDVAVGTACDLTNHTVENMIIKLSATKVHRGASILPSAFSSPGTVVGEDAVLLEQTQVLKGETVPTGEVWAGLPASQCHPMVVS
eukprot:TRINITY_DN29101_c0_g1_i1.p1 TRINITY_DN29101_c0_g1~~TRINITY_DN29101_c0_g1_i1.p1  ORF type:complete len:1726 (+),score=207.86 TRINITY_DN29101_c0_g1_i1:73-5178(+)